MRANIQKLISHTTTEKETVFGQPVLGLNARELIRDDLMNPLILPHLEFVPQDAHGLDIYKMFQLSKWLKHLKPDLQVQMVESNKKHFYIFEPVQLKTRVIVVPFFFFTHNEKYFAKCYKPIIKSDVDQSKLEIHLSSNIPYDDDRLKVISVDEFYLMYNEIAIKNGLKLSECCGGKMIGAWLMDSQKLEFRLPNAPDVLETVELTSQFGQPDEFWVHGFFGSWNSKTRRLFGSRTPNFKNNKILFFPREIWELELQNPPVVWESATQFQA
ncbi:hypothetical protein PSTG_13024 [Puccinia striiformis f. sp. tritici PST-78]|uniref:Uncharacterized protein n=1 Tax=Puccinia striiformis f. sp. tritici PST-78 TaxID=1165861 RepID=A0A0L0V2P7_9BASI|nr:hypothetical protein PSTG_13024 [Puccinia striiformis f. sp. tritici PST-78]